MKKVINKLMVLGCLMFTCISMTGCVWDGEGDIGQMAAPGSGDRPVVEGTEDEIFSYNLGYDDGLDSLGEELPDEEFYKKLDERIDQYPDRLLYDVYIDGHCQAGRDNGRNWILGDEKQPIETEVLFKTCTYELRADWIDLETKEQAAPYILETNLNYLVPELGTVTCEFAYTSGSDIVCNVYGKDRQRLGEGFYNLVTHELSHTCK